MILENNHSNKYILGNWEIIKKYCEVDNNIHPTNPCV